MNGDDDPDLVALGRHNVSSVDKKRPAGEDGADLPPSKRLKTSTDPNVMDIDQVTSIQLADSILQDLNSALASGDFVALARALEARLNQLAQSFSDSDAKYKSIKGAIAQFFATRGDVATVEQVRTALLTQLRRARSAELPRLPPCAGQVATFAASILASAYQDIVPWPAEFIFALLDDSLADRIWVDDSANSAFVERIINIIADPAANANLADVAGQYEVTKFAREQVLAVITHHLAIPNPPTKNIIKVMIKCCVWPQLRLEASRRLEAWLAEQSSRTLATDLMKKLAVECKTEDSFDLEAMRAFSRVHVASPSLVAQFHTALRTMLKNSASYAPIALREFILLDLFGHADFMGATDPMVSTSALPPPPEFDTRVLRVIVECIEAPLRVEAVVGSVIQELAWNVSLAPVLKSNVKALVLALIPMTTNFDFTLLCGSILRPPQFQVPPHVAEPFVTHLADVVCLIMLICIPSSLILNITNTNISNITSSSAATEKDKEKRAAAATWRAGVARLQLESLIWCEQTAVPLFMSANSNVPERLRSLLRKLLFLEPSLPQEWYRSVDAVVPTTNLLQYLPVEEDTIIRIILLRLKLGPQLGLSARDAIEIIDDVILRAAKYCSIYLQPEERETINSIKISNARLHDALFRLIPLVDQQQVAARELFWTLCRLLTVAGAFNPKTVGKALWDNVPTVKVLLEMLITKNFTFPPMISNESLIGGVTEEMLQKLDGPDESLIRLDVGGPARAPPSHLISELKRLDAELRLGVTLCASRDPDFVLMLIQRQQQQQQQQQQQHLAGIFASPFVWVGSVLHLAPSTITVVPPKILVQIYHQFCAGKHRDALSPPEVIRIGTILRDILFINGDIAKMFEILEYLLGRLSSSERLERSSAQRALAALVACAPDPTLVFQTASGSLSATLGSWLDALRKPSDFQTRFLAARDLILDQMISAMKVDIDPSTLEALLDYWLTTRELNQRHASKVVPVQAPAYRLVRHTASLLSQRTTESIRQMTSNRPKLLQILVDVFSRVFEKPNNEKLTKSSDSTLAAGEIVIFSLDSMHRRITMHVSILRSALKLLASTLLTSTSAEIHQVDIEATQQKLKHLESLIFGPIIPHQLELISQGLPRVNDAVPIFQFFQQDRLAEELVQSPSCAGAAMAALSALVNTRSLDEILQSELQFRIPQVVEALLLRFTSNNNSSSTSTLSEKALVHLSKLSRKFPSTTTSQLVQSILNNRRAVLLDRESEIDESNAGPQTILQHRLELSPRKMQTDSAMVIPLLMACLDSEAEFSRLARIFVNPDTTNSNSAVSTIKDILNAISLHFIHPSLSITTLTVKSLSTLSRLVHIITLVIIDTFQTRDHQHVEVLPLLREVSNSLTDLTHKQQQQTDEIVHRLSCTLQTVAALQQQDASASPESILVRQILIQSQLDQDTLTRCHNAIGSGELPAQQTVLVALAGKLNHGGIADASIRDSVIAFVWPRLIHFDHEMRIKLLNRILDSLAASPESITSFFCELVFLKQQQHQQQSRRLALVAIYNLLRRQQQQQSTTMIFNRILSGSSSDERLDVTILLDFIFTYIWRRHGGGIPHEDLSPVSCFEGAMMLLPPGAGGALFEPAQVCRLAELVLSERELTDHNNIGDNVKREKYLRTLMLVATAKQSEQNAKALMSHLSQRAISLDSSTLSWLRKKSSSASSDATKWWPLGAADVPPSRVALDLLKELYVFLPLESVGAVDIDLLHSLDSAQAITDFEPNPLNRIFHQLLSKLANKPELSEVAYLTLRKLVLLYPAAAVRFVAPLLLPILKGRAETLKQHHVQHKQRYNAAAIVATYFGEFIFSRQDHKVFLFVLGLSDAMRSAFLARDELLIPLLNEVLAVLTQLPEFFQRNLTDGSQASQSAAQQIQLELFPLVSKFVDIVLASLFQASQSVRSALITWASEVSLTATLDDLKRTFVNISRHVIQIGEALANPLAAQPAPVDESANAERKRQESVADELISEIHKLSSSASPTFAQTDHHLNVNNFDRVRTLLHEWDRFSHLNSLLALVHAKPLVDAIASAQLLTCGAFPHPSGMLNSPGASPDEASHNHHATRSISATSDHMEHLQEQIRMLAVKVCVRIGREDPKISMAVTSSYLGACKALLSQQESHSRTHLQTRTFLSLLKFAPDFFFLCGQSSLQQDILLMLWQARAFASERAPVDVNGYEDSTGESVGAAADFSLQQIAGTITSLYKT